MSHDRYRTSALEANSGPIVSPGSKDRPPGSSRATHGGRQASRFAHPSVRTRHVRQGHPHRARDCRATVAARLQSPAIHWNPESERRPVQGRSDRGSHAIDRRRIRWRRIACRVPDAAPAAPVPRRVRRASRRLDSPRTDLRSHRGSRRSRFRCHGERTPVRDASADVLRPVPARQAVRPRTRQSRLAPSAARVRPNRASSVYRT